MPGKKTPADRYAALTRKDLNQWAGSRIVGRGRSYQQLGRVSSLAITDDGGLIAWVDGSDRYATMVAMDEGCLPESICTCPYEEDCKHGVAVVIEYMERIENKMRVPKAKKDDERLELFESEDLYSEDLYDEPDDDDDDTFLSEDDRIEIDELIKDRTKAQLIELIHEIAEKYPEAARELVERRRIASGDVRSMVMRLRLEIRDIGEEPDWQDHWHGGGYTQDYSDIRRGLETLLKAGYADETLGLGEELMKAGTDQVKMSHDEGETAMEIACCMPVVVKALDQSSMNPADKLSWAADVVLKDDFDIFTDFFEYLNRKHSRAAWNSLADRLLKRLSGSKGVNIADNFSRSYARDQLSNWAIHALERADRKDEIIPLCEAEARKTGSYERLVKLLMAARRREEAERWIREGVEATEKDWPGIAANLRDRLREIRTRQRNWPVVAAMQAEKFVRDPYLEIFTDCKKAAGKIKAWPKVRGCILAYLESGRLPWEQKSWPLPESGLDAPGAFRDRHFPMYYELIDIGILEKKPDQVLRWYDKLPKKRFGWHDIDEDEIATAVQTHAPDRAVAIWKNIAEQFIGEIKPSAYREAAIFLHKAQKVMVREKKQAEWNLYIEGLRKEHGRKRRLMEILDGLGGGPVVKRRRRSGGKTRKP